MADRKYWIAVASLDHVNAARDANVLATGPNGRSAAERPSKGDWFAYYAPAETMEKKNEVQDIVAMGQIEDEVPESRALPDGGSSFSRAATYHGEGSVDIYKVVNEFSFIDDRENWGVYFRNRLFEVTKDDMLLIAQNLNVDGRKL